MYYLEPLHSNFIGQTFILSEADTKINKIQLQVSDIAIILSIPELKNLLEVISSYKSKTCCDCETCQNEDHLQPIKCTTTYSEVVFRIKKDRVNQFEALLSETLFNYEIQSILEVNNIKL
ncbi:hypothetical protein Q4566_10895 [Tamlana sp. 2_MG-2023]|uniref:hypothetical protein n=1 Tax=unclassified Tamlana TaxID=2614803 RepID=UPI0026E49110|nr:MULTISPECIES: hypothetical protein [unclassified Tamlana]MDO6760707.1 hypothetical protein [Tamlana sp. 2_MG-2023]MDO6790963.1 hypothetical protein [Tamlana sp. 1_MG-2023]